MAERYFGYSHEEICAHLQKEYDNSRNFVNQKRTLFRERMKDYTNVSADKDKIYVRLIYSVMQTLLALQYEDKMNADFVGRQLWADEVANQLNALAEFDYEEMDMDTKNYKLEWDRLFYGVGILMFDHWDSIKKCPVYRRVSPLVWIPDCNPDDIDGEKYHQFELEVSMSYLESRKCYNLKKLWKTINEQIEQNKQQMHGNRALNTVVNLDNIPVNYCFTTLGGKKFFVLTGMGNSVVLEMFQIDAVMEEEKKDARNIKFPVFTFHYSPLDYDPFGVSVPDLLADKQRAMQLLLNLEKTKAWQAAFGGIYAVDTNRVNINDLTRPSTTTRYISLKGWDLTNAVVEIPRSRPDQDVAMVQWQIKQQATLDIWLDERSLGVGGWANITATENQRIQKNANLKQILNTKLKNNSWKRFWADWYKRYYENFTWTDQKNIIINTKVSMRPIVIKRKDIVSWYDLDVKIVSTSEREAEREKEKMTFPLVLQTIVNDPSTPLVSKRMALRKNARLHGATNEEAMMYFPADGIELQALNNVELLNNNVLPDVREASIDPFTHRIIAHRAINTKAKFAYIEALTMLEIRLWQQQYATQWGNGQWMMNQIANRAMQQPEQEASSLQDLK